ncbi:MAG: aldo/keto reductase, partial [Beijerinckiaceae bacterium]
LSGAYPALHDLRAQGVVKAIGIGVNEAEICTRFAHETDMDIVLLAGRYSLLEQPALTEFFPLAMRKNIDVLLGGVFNSGILATGNTPDARYNYSPAPPDIRARVDRIAACCEAFGLPLRIAALHFAAAHPVVKSVVLGAVTPQEVTDNIAAMTATIPAALWHALKAEGLLAPDAPTPDAAHAH